VRVTRGRRRDAFEINGGPEAGFDPQPASPKSEKSNLETSLSVETLEQRLQEAYSRGRRESLEEAEQGLGKTADALAEALEGISRLRESLLKNSTQDMLSLILVIARQVLQTELVLNSNIILETVENALQIAVRADSYQIRVNPADLAKVEEKKPLFLARINGLKNITFTADAKVSRGGCLAESEFGEVDATIESQFEVIRNTLCGAAEEAD
jgi:flagellar assembly protein FliH